METVCNSRNNAVVHTIGYLRTSQQGLKNMEVLLTVPTRKLILLRSILSIKFREPKNKTQDASEESDGNAEIEKKPDDDGYDEFVASIMDGDADGVRLRKVSGMTLHDGAHNALFICFVCFTCFEKSCPCCSS